MAEFQKIDADERDDEDDADDVLDGNLNLGAGGWEGVAISLGELS